MEGQLESMSSKDGELCEVQIGVVGVILFKLIRCYIRNNVLGVGENGTLYAK